MEGTPRPDGTGSGVEGVRVSEHGDFVLEVSRGPTVEERTGCLRTTTDGRVVEGS